MTVPRRVTPHMSSEGSSTSTPYDLEIDLVMSAITGMFILPRPPLLRGVLIQARWEKTESTEMAARLQLSAANSALRSEKAVISVGHTNVKSRGYQKRTVLLDSGRGLGTQEVRKSPCHEHTPSRFSFFFDALLAASLERRQGDLDNVAIDNGVAAKFGGLLANNQLGHLSQFVDFVTCQFEMQNEKKTLMRLLPSYLPTPHIHLVVCCCVIGEFPGPPIMQIVNLIMHIECALVFLLACPCLPHEV
jgi:hypothetical protein